MRKTGDDRKRRPGGYEQMQWDPKRNKMRSGTQCRFCRGSIKYIDYKDVGTLGKLLTHRGKIYSRKRSGNCAGCQRKVKKAIKRARYMALLPYTA